MFAFNTRPAGYRRAAALRRWRSSAWCGTPLPSRDACFIASLRYPATPYLHVSTGSVKAKIQGKDVTDSVKAKIQGKDVTDSVKAKIQDKGVTDSVKAKIQDKGVTDSVKAKIQDDPYALAA
ncbi:hypothetical protein AURDEDRAFT_173007 [Auricularia subglabra TFB-10046 SS5]|uniref:Uncharacterized protein n=1 Tax=Auricularia subglabra (strain TFB-10046 / SS5) TaxID=717982 RepID=J0LHX2_AURST|nr:hypothetical protein AURDEDRAFT_173007 [Auricularia subglabra TFB-10046 SS5]